LTETEICKLFETWDRDSDEHYTPMQCPKCKGFLKWVEQDGELQPICNKCKAPLIAIYDAPEDEADAAIREKYNWNTGKVCIRKEMY
jgi:Zn-finger nucleic acid-binding protein